MQYSSFTEAQDFISGGADGTMQHHISRSCTALLLPVLLVVSLLCVACATPFATATATPIPTPSPTTTYPDSSNPFVYPSVDCVDALPLIEQDTFSEIILYVDPTYGILQGIDLIPRSSPQATPNPSFLPDTLISDGGPKCEHEVLQEVKDFNSKVPRDQQIQVVTQKTLN